MPQPKALTPVDRALRLLEHYGIALKPDPASFQFRTAVELVQVVDQLRIEAEGLQDRFGDIYSEVSPNEQVSTSVIQFGDLGTKFTIIVALLAERSRLLKTLEAFAK